MAQFDIAGKKACVTGASSGIGQALATALARAGASVVGVARRADALTAWQDACKGEDLSVDFVTGNLGDLDQAEAIGKAVEEKAGGIDIVVNAAGINPRDPADTITPDAWRAVLDLNLSSPFFFARAFVPGMRARGWGRIVNIASLQSERAFPDGIAYGASKGGIAQTTRAMAEAWSADGITANAIAPGFFPTELTRPVFGNDAVTDKLAAQTCIGRNGVLDDLVGPMLFFASDASRYVTGQVLYVDGGFTAK